MQMKRANWWDAGILFCIAFALCCTICCGTLNWSRNHFDSVISTCENDRNEMRTKYKALSPMQKNFAGYATCGWSIDDLSDAIFTARGEIGTPGKHTISELDLLAKDKKAKDACRTLLSLP